MKLILLRHGESQWNLENKFTGWKDVALTQTGIEEAKFAAKQLIENNLKIKSIHTSLLSRATETALIISNIIGFSKKNINYEWRLNERHYGALQGLNKSETAKKYGEKQVKIWRRSYDIPPPLIDINDDRHPRFNNKFNNITSELPSGESLKNVIDRLKPFWDNYITNFIKENHSHLIVAHSNSLRAVVKILDNLSENDILEVNIPTGVPLLYKLDQNLNVQQKEYLISDEKLKEKQELIVNQGRIK